MKLIKNDSFKKLKPETIITKDLKNINQISIKIIKNTFEELIFDITGIDAAIANALRRIMLAEVLK